MVPDVLAYSGIPTWKCEAQREYLTESLQTYVRGKPAHMMHDHHHQHCVVPAAVPSSLTLNTNGAILSWTPLDGVCGYVVYAYTLLPLSNIEEPTSVVSTTTNMYAVLQDDNLLVVRGYSDLLGPASQITVKGECVQKFV